MSVFSETHSLWLLPMMAGRSLRYFQDLSTLRWALAEGHAIALTQDDLPRLRAFLEALEPVCYDAEGSATTLPARLYREELRAQGLPEDEVRRRIAAAYQDGRLRAPRKPGLVYMLAPEQWSWNPFAKKFWNAPPHFMLYAPFATQEALGGFSGPHMPVVDSPGQPDALIIIMAQDSTHLRSTDSRKPSH